MNEIGIGAGIFAAVVLVLEIISKLTVWKAKDATIETKDATIEKLKEHICLTEKRRAPEFVEDPQGRIRDLETLYATAQDTIGTLAQELEDGKLTGAELAEVKKRLEEREKQIDQLKMDIDTLRRTTDKPDVRDFRTAAVSAIGSTGVAAGGGSFGIVDLVSRGCIRCGKSIPVAQLFDPGGGLCDACRGKAGLPPAR